jgi:hypothetical protein
MCHECEGAAAGFGRWSDYPSDKKKPAAVDAAAGSNVSMILKS